MLSEDPTCTGGDHATVLAAIAAIGRGEMVLVVDDHDREDEADLVAAAEGITAETVNFMVTRGRGLVCAPMTAERLDELGLRDMCPAGTDPLGTRFTISVDLEVPGCTGISAAARARTIGALADPATTAAALRTPGHIFPLRYADGGVLVRRGHTEASVDLARLAGRAPAAAICEVMAEDGTMLRGDGITAFALEHGLLVVSIEELVAYRRATESLHVADVEPARPIVTRVVETVLPNAHGIWRTVGFRDESSGAEHLVLVLGEPAGVDAPLVRLHSECRTGDVLGSHRCDCGDQLEKAFRTIADEGAGVIVYLGGHEGRGIGLLNKLRAYELQDAGLDTVDANLALGLPEDARSYDQSAAMLAELGLDRVRLLTNNPLKVAGLSAHGIEVAGAVPLRTPATLHSAAYLHTKQRRMAHSLAVVADEGQPIFGGWITATG